MNADDRLRVARGALSRWRDEARRLFRAQPMNEYRDLHAPELKAYVYSAQLAALVLRLEREAAS